MIMSVEEFKTFVTTDIPDAVLEAKLQALELLVRKYTNNNFQDRRFRTIGEVKGDQLTVANSAFFNAEDTIMIEGDLCTIKSVDGDTITIDRWLFPDDKCLVTKVVYPMDVKMGVVNMMQWDMENRDKVGIQSETISRHSVTYFNLDGDNSTIGFPKPLIGFLKPYKKARF